MMDASPPIASSGEPRKPGRRAMDRRPAVDLDRELPQAPWIGKSASRCRGHVGPCPIWQRVQLYTHFGEEVGPEPRADFRELVRRRAEGAPVAYLVGRKEFYSLPFEVTSAS